MSTKIKSGKEKAPVKRYRRIIGMDMGSTNTAATVLRAKFHSKSGKIIAISHLHTQMMQTIKDLTQSGFAKDHSAFISFFEKFIDKWKPDVLMAERFISRGLRGSQGEKVSAMLFTMATICKKRGIEFILVSAQAWKNTFNRKYFYPEKLNELYLMVGKTKNAHRVDATLIAAFAVGGFEFLAKKNRIDQLIVKVKP